jgi:hypothetical protein
MPKSLVGALRRLRVTEGLGVSTMITIAVSEWLKGKKINLEVRF